ncbi:MAG: hypothetical protein HWN80_12090 [Candidatus Lokiarchaeota archaeon]|nr:hypothetical protein [Candidatus Lokiarchaeota archaeon]
MASDYSVICKLGGYVNSNPELISSFPSLDQSSESEVLSKCFPIGSKYGEFIVDKYRKYVVLSYIFRVNQTVDRDDLFSLSVLLNKRDKTEIYMPALKSLINILDANSILSQDILTEYQQVIFEGINQEKDINIENVLIDFSNIFKEIKSKVLKQKPELKGSFL